MYPLHKFVEENALEEARCLAGVRELLEYSKSGVLGNTIAGATRPLQGSLFTRRLVYTPSWPSGVDYGARLISARFPRNRWNAIRAEFCLVPPFFASLIIIIILITIIVVVVGATRHDHRADPGRGRRQPRQPQLLPRPAPDVGRLRRVVYRRRGPDWRRPHRQDVGARPLVRSIALPLHCHCTAHCTGKMWAHDHWCVDSVARWTLGPGSIQHSAFSIPTRAHAPFRLSQHGDHSPQGAVDLHPRFMLALRCTAIALPIALPLH